MEGLAGQAGVFAGREELVGSQNVDQVMGNTTTFALRCFCSTDVEVAVDLQRIAVDDFAVKLSCNFESQIAFPRAGGSGHCNQREFRRVCLGGRLQGVFTVRGDCVVAQTLASKPRYTI
jgi:hypothetical protein